MASEAEGRGEGFIHVNGELTHLYVPTSVESVCKHGEILNPFPVACPMLSHPDDRNYPQPGRIGDPSDLIGSVLCSGGKVRTSLSFLSPFLFGLYFLNLNFIM